MPVLLAVVALGLMAYLPGRSLLRLLVREEAGDPPRSRLLLELLLGNSAVALIAFPLAELGLFSLPAVLAGLLAVTALSTSLTRHRAVAAYAAADAAGLAVAIFALAWLMPPFDTTLYGYDSSVYVASGRSLVRHGGLAFVDPTIDEIPLAKREQFFPSFDRDTGRAPFLRLPGGLVLTSLEQPVVLPAFHHLLAVWVGLAQAIAGEAAATAPAVYFGALALWAVVSFAHTLAGPTCAGLSAALLLLSVPQYWYSRFLMPEVPSQYFLWAGLVAAGASFEVAGWLGVAAGVGLGVAGLMRLDGLAHTVAALALWRALAPGRPWPAGRGFLPAFAALAGYAALHQVLFPTHYYAEVTSLLREGLSHLSGLMPQGLAAMVVLGGAMAVGGGVAGRLRSTAVRLAAAALFAAYAAATLATTRPDPATAVDWLQLYLGWPVLVAAVAGAVVWWKRSVLPAQGFALLLGAVVLVQLAYDPRVTPAPLWAIRRFVPTVVPVLLVAAAVALSAVGRGRRWLLGLGFALFVGGTLWRTSLTYGSGEILERNQDHVKAISALLPPGAAAVFDPDLALDSQLHIALWGLADVPAYLLGGDMVAPLQELRTALTAQPLYWVSAKPPSASLAIGRSAEAVASYRFGAITRRLNWYDTREDLGLRDVTVWIYRLRPVDPAAALH